MYLSTEHRYKEKEYGISWRTAYKTFVATEFKKLVGLFGNPLNDGAHELEVIGALVERDWKDVRGYYENN